jgi:hypothetical protein
MKKPSFFARLLMVMVTILLGACQLKTNSVHETGTPTFVKPQPEKGSSTPNNQILSTQTEQSHPSKPVVSQERLFSFLDKLTKIKPYSGWRLSATEGEKVALQYVEQEIQSLPYLNSLNLEVEWQTFHVPISLQIWNISLQASLNGSMITIPASGLRGWRSSIADRLLMDSDGNLNDSNHDPITVSGNVIIIQDQTGLDALNSQTEKGSILFINDGLLMNDAYSGNTSYSVENKLSSVNVNPAAFVIVTQNSNIVGENHGTFANEIGPISTTRLPVVQMRAEDAIAGNESGWNLIKQLESATVTWDTDLFAPGTSHNLIVRIPGKDPTRAMILSAHIDSVGNPGAMDDGSGSAILLEIAHVLDENKIQPETDVYLAWFGSEELGLYGSTYFVNTHQALLDRTIADLQVDCLSRPLDGVKANIQLAFWPGNWEQKDASPWVNSMTTIASSQGIETHKMIINLASDNSRFDAYNVPNLDVIYDADDEMNSIGGVWYGGHIHDPYDTVQTARDSSEPFVQMAQIALEGALLPAGTQDFRTTPATKHKAIFIATHTEPPLMTPTGLADFSGTLAKVGFDVDLIPYGTSFTESDLKDAEIVFVMPVADYPSSAGDVNQYDESWAASEIQVLQDYVKSGGFLVITNSSQITGNYGDQLDENEDWGKMNGLSEVFGIKYTTPSVGDSSAEIKGDHPLINSITRLEMVSGEAVAFQTSSGQTLASIGDAVIASIVSFGDGKVLALADLGMFSSGYYGLLNEQFINNIAEYAANR